MLDASNTRAEKLTPSKNDEADQLLKPLTIIVVLLSILFRWAVAVGPYSGENKPPLFGDYEAHRHWMEITYNLPIDSWYHNGTDNDLLYWGLDYPPLTAYHSYFLGYVANKINGSWIELNESRGLESYTSKFFMRWTVFVSDFFTLLPALFIYSQYFMQKSLSSVTLPELLGVTLFYPGFLLIDYGHFQYNCVSLGLFLFSVIFLTKKFEILSSICFVWALNHKQMEFYHALPIFAYLFGSCLKLPTSQGYSIAFSLVELCVVLIFLVLFSTLLKFMKLSFTVIIVFLIVWWPFLKTFDGLVQVLIRIFPLARGIYEDKVANVWCSLSIFIKWKLYFTNENMALISSLTTIILAAPSVLMLIARPSIRQMKYALIVCSSVFFLFSFQVHEKTILLVALPVLLIYDEDPLYSGWFLIVSVLSLFPLAIKDEMVSTFLALYICYFVWLCDLNRFFSKRVQTSEIWSHRLLVKIFTPHSSFFIGLFLCLTTLIFEPPTKYPDLYVILNCLFCCFHFCLFFFYFYYKQYRIYLYGKFADFEHNRDSKRKKQL